MARAPMHACAFTYAFTRRRLCGLRPLPPARAHSVIRVGHHAPRLSPHRSVLARSTHTHTRTICPRAATDTPHTHARTVLSLLLHVTSLPVRPPYIHPPVRLHCCIMCTRLQYVSRHMYPRMACTCCATLPQHDAHGCTVDPASASASAAALLRRTHSRCFFGFFGFTYVGIGQETSVRALLQRHRAEAGHLLQRSRCL